MILHQNPWQDHNGATHRRNFDTPPLRGSCRYTKVNLHITDELPKTPVYPGIPAPEIHLMSLLVSQKTVFRNTTRCLKLTEEEARLLDEVARANGVARSEWMREVILRELRNAPTSDASLAEILGVRLLLVNVLRPLAAGQRLTAEAFDKLLDEISTAKHELAGKLANEKRR